jgi:hypothetical protein
MSVRLFVEIALGNGSEEASGLEETWWNSATSPTKLWDDRRPEPTKATIDGNGVSARSDQEDLGTQAAGGHWVETGRVGDQQKPLRNKLYIFDFVEKSWLRGEDLNL